MFALATFVVVAQNAGSAAGTVTTLVTTDPTECVECAECAAEPTPEPTPEVALRVLTTPEPEPDPTPTDSPSDPPPTRWDPFQYTFRVDIDANFKPTFNKAKSGADPANRSDALDEIKAGEDKRHNCFTITFDGPLDLVCDEKNFGVQFFGETNRPNQKLSLVSVEQVERAGGEKVLRVTYRFERFQEKGFYDIQLNCKTPRAP
jgi:hypothetical protein